MVDSKNSGIQYNPDNDFLLLNGDNTVRKFIRDEVVLFSDIVDKVNHYGMNQQRNLLLTEKAVYNLKGKELKRRIDLATIKGVSVTKDTHEFVIHCIDLEYDYYYFSAKKKKILQYLDVAFLGKYKKYLPLCAMDVKSLNDYVTTKVEKKKDINFTRMPDTGLITISDYVLGGGFSNETRKRAFSKITKLNEYKKLKLIGNGTHSKVVLVEYKNTSNNKEYYAMKCIRKDLVIENDMLDSLKNEIKVLGKTDNPFLINILANFQDENYVYLVMPFMRGGDLYEFLRKNTLELDQ